MEKPITLTVLSTDTRAEIRDTITAGDSDAYPLSITFSDLTAITGTVRFRFVRGDDYWDRDAAVAGNVASLMLEPAFYAAPGTELWVSFEDSNLYTPLHVYFRDIRVPSGNVAAETSQPYPAWAADMRALDFDIGTVETLEPGADATASITGDIPDKVLNLGIPQGIQGEKGDTGASGTIDGTTLSTLSGILAGNGSTVAVATDAQAAAQPMTDPGNLYDSDTTGGQLQEVGDKVGELKSALDSKCSTYKNVLDLETWFAGASGITVSGDGVVRGTGNSFKGVSAYSPAVKENTRYTLSFNYYCEQNVSSSSVRGINIIITYTDSTTDSIALMEDINAYAANRSSLVTDYNKTISNITFTMQNHGSNYYRIKELMLEEGETLTEYVPYLIPNDSKARDSIAPLEEDVTNIKNAIGTKMTELIGGYTLNYWNDETSTAVLTSISSGYVAYNPIEVTPGKKYHIKAYQGGSNKQDTLLFVNNDYGILSKYGTRQTNYYERDVIAPDNAKYALITVGTRISSYLDNTSFKQYDLNDVSEIASEVSVMESVTQLLNLNGKNVAIIGDSISTNGDLTSENPYGNVPEILIGEDDVGVELSAYATYYDVGVTVGGHEIVSADVGTEITFTPVAGDVGKMVGKPLSYNSASKIVWWEVLQSILGFNPIPVCWSGASVSSHEGNDEEYKTSYAWHDAQIRKCGIRTPGTMTRTAPDVIIINRGTNDFSHSPYAELTAGYFEPYNWEYPVTDELASGYGYKEALCLTIKKLRNTYPKARIILCTLNVFKRVNYSHFPTNNGTVSLPQYNDAIREVADFMGCGLIEFDKDGITFENCYSEGYITDSETTPTHPSDKGHKVMGNRALADLAKAYNDMT